MKNLLFILLFAVKLSMLFAKETDSFTSNVISSEYNSVNGSFDFTIKYKFINTTAFVQNTEFDLPEGWTATVTPAVAGNTYYAGDSIFVAITVNYPTNNLPFFAQPIEVKQFIRQNGLSNTDFTDFIEKTVSAMIYFTPYNTIEIWNSDAYADLPRRWLTSTNSPVQQRVYIDKNNIPISDIDLTAPINWHDPSRDWEDDWMDNFREISIPGLAYRVLMKPIPPDSIAFYDNIGDGPDSTGTQFTGSVSGYLKAYLKNDIGQYVYIPLAGIKVKLIEHDFYGYQEFAETYTAEDGSFSMSYDESQILEGKYVELALRFKSFSSDEYKITASNFWGNRYEYTTYQWSAPKTASAKVVDQTFTLEYPSEAFKAIHWARKGFQYFKNQGVTLQKNLQIKPYVTGDKAGSWYEPRIVPPSFEPTIHLEAGDAYRENTIYHEFGHFAMHRLQNNNFTIPFGENGVAAHDWPYENTSRLAWVEGWADAIQMILDAAYWQEDGEYGLDEDRSFPWFEVREHNSWSPSNPTFNKINNGFRSEYYIACAIYDLWDGANRNLPNLIPNSSFPFNFIDHGWDDSNPYNSWESIDDVEINFYTLCRPLLEHYTDPQNHNEGGYFFNEKCFNIQDYILYLLDYITDCNLKADISRVFRENRVLWNIPEYEWGWNVTNVSSDPISADEQKDESGYVEQLFWGTYDFHNKSWTDYYLVNYYNENAVNDFHYFAYPQYDLKITDNYWLGIWDTYSSVYRRSNLFLNDYLSGLGNATYGTYTTCGGIEIDARYGNLTLGGAQTTANLEITDGSVLRFRGYGTINDLLINSGSTIFIKSGGTLYIQSGSDIRLKPNSKIIVEPGGYICIENGAIINLEGTNSIIELESGALAGLNPALNITPSPSCLNPKDITIIGNGQVIYVCEDFVNYTHINETNFNSSFPLNGVNYIFKENLRITNNSTVTINNSELQFAKGKKTIIEPGSTLILNNTKLTNLTECGGFWAGIEVQGNKNQPQQSQYQGTIDIKSGTVIENAMEAITTIKTVAGNWDWSFTGGIIRASNSAFKNCRRAAQFLSYDFPNTSYFSNCTFETTGLLPDPAAKPYSFVSLYDVKGVKFYGCTFRNTAPDLFDAPDRGVGIISIDAAYNVIERCTSQTVQCTSFQRGKFENLYYGINASNASNLNTIRVNKTLFTSNTQGILLTNNENATITSNTFDVGQINDPVTPYGLYLNNCTGYLVEDNDFFSTQTQFALGTVVNNASKQTNRIYKNRYHDISIGAQHQHGAFKGIGTPFQFKCNDFSLNPSYDVDIAVTSGIIGNQGSCSNSTADPAGNTFGPCITPPANYKHIWTNTSGVSNFNYYHHPDPSTTPGALCYTPGKVTPVACTTAYTTNSCPSTLVSPNNPSELKQIITQTEALNTLLATGDVPSLYQIIASNSSPGQIKNALLTPGPYLSDGVLISAITRPSPLPPGHIKEIVIPNSPVTQPVMTALNSVSLPKGIRKQINDAQTSGISPRAFVEQQLAALPDYDLAVSDLLRQYLGDTLLENPLDSVIAFLQTKNTLSAKQSLIEAYLANSSCSEARTLYNQINSTTDADYNSFSDLSISLCEQGRTFFELTTSEKQLLDNLAIQTGNAEVAAGAQSILRFVYGEQFPEVIEELIVPDSFKIHGTLFDSPACGGAPVAGDTLVMLDSASQVVPSITPAVTDVNGNFSFDFFETAGLDPTAQFTFATKSGAPLQNPGSKTITQWINGGAVILTLAEIALQTGLVADYPFNGNAHDASGNGHNSSYNTATLTTDRFGNANSAYSFDGASVIEVPHSSELDITGDKTITAWTYIPTGISLQGYPTVISKVNTASYYPTYMLFLTESSLYSAIYRYKYDFLFGNGTTNYDCVSKQLFTSYFNQWVYVAGTYSMANGVPKIYINGILSDSLITPPVSSNSSTNKLTIGSEGNASGTFFIGKIDDIRIYDRVLTDCEIYALYTSADTTGSARKKDNESTNQQINNFLSLYPNPNDGNMQVEYTIPENETGEFELHDLVGRKQLGYILQGGQNTLTVSRQQLTDGVYFYRLISNGNVLQQGKIVIITN